MSNKKIQELNVKLQQLYLDGNLNDVEKVFEIGVEFGREYERAKIETSRAKFWLDKEQSDKENNDKRNRIINAQEKIDNFFQILISLSIKDTIKKEGSFTFAKRGCWGADFSRFKDEVAETYQIEYLGCDMQDYGGSFDLEFKAVGELEKTLNKYNVSTWIKGNLCNNSGEEDVSYSDVKDFEEDLYSISAYARNAEWDVSEYENFLEEISKPFVFIIAKNTGND